MYSSRIRSETAHDLFARARALPRNGHAQRATLPLGRAESIEPDEASVREALGRALLPSGRWGRAGREFATFAHLPPNDDYARFALALACERTGETERARAHAKLAAALRLGIRDHELLRRLDA